MNSRSKRFIKRYIFAVVLSYLCSPLSQASDLVVNHLELTIRTNVLNQWQALGLRAGATSKVIISGIPQGYKSPACISPLEVKPINVLKLGRNSIQVSCQHRSSWSLMLNADIEVWRKVVVLRDHLSRGQRVTSTSVVLQQRNIGDLQRGYYTEINSILGNVSKRSLKAGTAISPSMTNLPIIIKRGQDITLRAERPGFAVNMKGTALKKGRKGDKIKVKNSSSNKVLFGTIVNADLILID
ncbi:MAG: flagellar basal body P-ring formation chaperone FlgA [Oleispira sp.]